MSVISKPTSRQVKPKNGYNFQGLVLKPASKFFLVMWAAKEPLTESSLWLTFQMPHEDTITKQEKVPTGPQNKNIHHQVGQIPIFSKYHVAETTTGWFKL